MARVQNRTSVSLAREAYLHIRNKILSGNLPIGSPISRRGLARDLNMSVVPVSDALQLLETEGLVESWPRVGTRVKVPTVQDIRGHYVVREALESQAARLFSEKASSVEREQILDMGRHLDQRYEHYGAGKRSDNEAFELHEEHFRFHMRVAECSGHRALCEAIERNQILIFNWLYDTAANRISHIPLPIRHHSVLAEALAQRDPAKADAAMRLHVLYGCEDLLLRFEALFSTRLIVPVKARTARRVMDRTDPAPISKPVNGGRRQRSASEKR